MDNDELALAAMDDDGFGCAITSTPSGPEGFYVSVMDHGRSGMLLGPYATKADAESEVRAGKRLAEQVNSRAFWYAYGVTRVVMQPGAALPEGKLNELARQALTCGH